MSEYKPYPAYKDSGVEWLGAVPEDWVTKKLMYWITRYGSGTTPSAETDYCEDGVAWVTTGELRESSIIKTDKYVTLSALDRYSALAVHPAGSIAIAMYGATIGRLGYLGVSATVNQACFVIHPSKLVNMRFLSYWFEAIRPQLILLAAGAGQPNISGDKIRNFELAAPVNLDEQNEICAFLDSETARIDALVAKKTRFIELLREKRQALITQAVTRGLDPNVKLKGSGVEWLGEVPEHWELLPLKYLIAKIESGTSVNSADVPANAGEFGVLKTSCVYSGKFQADENKAVIQQEYDRVSCPLRQGTLIVSRMNTPDLVGAAGLVTHAPEGLYLPDRLWQIYFANVITAFAYYWTQSVIYRTQVKMVCTGASSSMQNLSQDQFGDFIIAKPPAGEQQAIVAYLDQETTRLDTLIQKTQQSLDLLKERRAALITAAVTGQIDVRNAG